MRGGVAHVRASFISTPVNLPFLLQYYYNPSLETRFSHVNDRQSITKMSHLCYLSHSIFFKLYILIAFEILCNVIHYGL